MLIMNPCQFYKCLAEDTRLHSLLLIEHAEEACVCDLMEALELDQPKISRHLASLRKCGLLLDERRGKWVYYRLHPDLAPWAKEVISLTATQNPEYFAAALERLQTSQRNRACC